MNKTPKYSLLLIDIDDTIIDYQKTENDALAYVYYHYFSDVTSLEVMNDEFRRINMNLWVKYRNNELSLHSLREKRFRELSLLFNLRVSIVTMTKDYESKLEENVYPYNDAISFIKTISNNENIDLVILSNGIAKIQRAKLNKLDITNCFKDIIISEEVGYQKPTPEIYEIALHNANKTPKDALVIGDSLTSDMLGAKNSKIDFCWMNRESFPLPKKFPSPQYTVSNYDDIYKILGLNTD